MVPAGVGSRERREAVEKSVVSAALVTKIVTRTVMQLRTPVGCTRAGVLEISGM